MNLLVSPENGPGRLFHGNHIVLTAAVIVFGVLFCTSFSEGLNDEKRGDLLLTLRIKSDQPASAVLGAIRRRAEALGASEEDVVEKDSKTISVRLPGYKQDAEKAARIMEKRALLEFKLVDDKADVVAAEKGNVPPGYEILYKVDKNARTGAITRKPYVTRKQALMTGEAIAAARLQPGYMGNPMVMINFNEAGARKFERITSEHVNEPLAIVLDGRVYSAPVIKDRISGGAAVIEGAFNREEAEELALVLRCGPLGAPVEVVKSEWVKPRSGKK